MGNIAIAEAIILDGKKISIIRHSLDNTIY